MNSLADEILERKLSLCKTISEGLPRQLRLQLRIIAIEEAQEESGADYTDVLDILKAAQDFSVNGRVVPFEVNRILTAIRNIDGVGFCRGGYLYIESGRFTALMHKLHASRIAVLRELACMGMLKMSGEDLRFTFQMRVNGAKGRYVVIKWFDDGEEEVTINDIECCSEEDDE